MAEPYCNGRSPNGQISPVDLDAWPYEVDQDAQGIIEFVTLSSQLDQALMMAEYHRDQLMYWRQRQAELERQIEQPIDELSEVAEQVFRDADYPAAYQD